MGRALLPDQGVDRVTPRVRDRGTSRPTRFQTLALTLTTTHNGLRGSTAIRRDQSPAGRTTPSRKGRRAATSVWRLDGKIRDRYRSASVPCPLHGGSTTYRCYRCSSEIEHWRRSSRSLHGERRAAGDVAEDHRRHVSRSAPLAETAGCRLHPGPACSVAVRSPRGGRWWSST